MTYRNTHQLQEGDVVEAHDCHFALRKCLVCKLDEYGTTHCWKTELIAYNLSNSKNPSMPLHWAQTWTIQGNENVEWKLAPD